MGLFRGFNKLFKRSRRANQKRQDAATDPHARRLRPIDAEQLEDRVLFNAAPIDLMAIQDVDAAAQQDAMQDALAGLADAAQAQHAFAELPDPPDQTELDGDDDVQAGDAFAAEPEVHKGMAREIVLIDRSVQDYETLVADLQASSKHDQFDIVFINTNEDGIKKITSTLAERGEYDAVHIVSHGNDRGIRIGDTWLSESTLQYFQDDVASWGNALTESGDLLFYGCDLAESAEGRTLLDSVGELCDCDVAASEDATGSALLGGDWELEYHLQPDESAMIISRRRFL